MKKQKKKQITRTQYLMRHKRKKYKELRKIGVSIYYLHKFTDIVSEEYYFNPGEISNSVIDNIAISIVNEYLTNKDNYGT